MGRDTSARCRSVHHIHGTVSRSLAQEPVVHVYAPDEARKHARPLPSREQLVIEDITDEEWKAFQEALAEA